MFVLNSAIFILSFVLVIVVRMYCFCDRVRPSDRIKLSVSKVTSDQYDRLHSDLFEIRKIGMQLL